MAIDRNESVYVTAMKSTMVEVMLIDSVASNVTLIFDTLLAIASQLLDLAAATDSIPALLIGWDQLIQQSDWLTLVNCKMIGRGQLMLQHDQLMRILIVS